jgi:hypothetical protein
VKLVPLYPVGETCNPYHSFTIPLSFSALAPSYFFAGLAAFFAGDFFAGDFFTTPFATLFAFGFVVLVPDLGLGAALGFAAAFATAGFFATAFFAGDFFVTPPVAAFVFGAGFGFVVFVPEVGFVAVFAFAGALAFVEAFFTGFFESEGGDGAGFLVVAARGRCLRIPAVRIFCVALGLVTFPAALGLDRTLTGDFAGEDLGLGGEALAGESLAGDNFAGDLVGDFPGLLKAAGAPLEQTGLDMMCYNCRSEVEIKERRMNGLLRRWLEMNKKINCLQRKERERERELFQYFTFHKLTSAFLEIGK